MSVTLEDVRSFLEHVVAPAIYPDRIPLDVTARHLPGEPLPAAEAVGGPFAPFAVGSRWGGMWATTWFRCQASVPAGWAGREVVAIVHLGGARVVGFSAEGLIWTPDLRPVQGLHHEHREYRISEGAVRGEVVDFYIEAAANPIPRWHMKDWPRLEPDYAGPSLYALEQADLATVDRDVEGLWRDLDVVVQIAEGLESRRADCLAALDDAVGAVAAGGPGACAKARLALRPVLDARGGVTEPGGRHEVRGVGHAHIDTAWLWPMRETRRKCARSFANQLRLLERYPEHQFVCSQAVQYEWVKEGYPDIYEGIRAMVDAGRWEPVGGMWVEADSNLPSGESLVRQFVLGKRFFASEFGVETHEMWIPDVFGYSAALPQIARGVGIDVLITQKMSWNDTNPFPHSTFWWEGHDGSRVLAHFPPAGTYNGNVSVAELRHDEGHFRDGDRTALTLYPFGYGDGGGGPSAGQLEAARRLRDIEGLPRLTVAPLREFLGRLRHEAEGAGLDTWVGELYLEAHRATSTTHADIKLANRRSEEALRAAELWSVAAGLGTHRPRGGPGAGLTLNHRLEPLWKLLLLHQVHDILPGSSIGWVYREAALDHTRILEGCQAMIEQAQDHLAAPDGPHLVAFNPSTYDRAEPVDMPDGSLRMVLVTEGYLDNGLLRVGYDPTGRITSIWDYGEDREVLATGSVGNVFQLHDDRPKAFDAWDVDIGYLATVEELDTPLDGPGEVAPQLVEHHPLRASIRFRRRFHDSTLTQTVRVAAGSRRVDFLTEVDWQERHRFLKVAFPVAVRAERAAFEIQHGFVERPTHANTSWDRARFEVWAHRWADLSEPGYGVALLNDGKYGYDVRGHTLRLSLLRGPGYPDPDADRGHHRFTYALLPHPGGLQEGRVVEEAEALNRPVSIRAGHLDRPDRLIALDRPGVSVEAVKAAEDGDGVIVRLCEVHGSRRPVMLMWGRPFRAVERVDLLERASAPMDHQGRSVRVALRPFELVTLRFRPMAAS
jgi:alpha-mannosidase